ncbi:MAG: OmpA family protein [Elusimicrobiota bacterium]
MQKLKLLFMAITMVFLTLNILGCPKKPVVKLEPEKVVVTTPLTPSTTEQAITEDTQQPEDNLPAEPEIRGKEWDEAKNLKTVIFDYDKFDVRDDMKSVVETNAEVLKKNGDVTILIEGHSCECGTVEYNLGLGQRRAKILREYYAQLGIDPARIATISYGEEMLLHPGACVNGDSELGAQNRRAVTKLQKK